MKHLISPMDLSVEETDALLALAGKMYDHPEQYAHLCEGKKLATCFYEPSTRTRLSFEAAMLNLGGSTRSASSPTTPISARCGIQRKALRLLPLSTPESR